MWLSPAVLSQTCSRPEKNPLNPVLICVCASSTKKSFPSNGHCNILWTSGICCRGTNEPPERVAIPCSGFDCLQCIAALGESSPSVPQFPHRARDLFPPGSEFHWNTGPLRNPFQAAPSLFQQSVHKWEGLSKVPLVAMGSSGGGSSAPKLRLSITIRSLRARGKILGLQIFAAFPAKHWRSPAFQSLEILGIFFFFRVAGVVGLFASPGNF